MTLFLSLAALMLVGALAIVLLPLLRNRRAGATTTPQLRALEAARAAGVIDAEEYASKRAALGLATATHAPRASFAAALAIALLLPLSAILLYRAVGTPRALDPTALAVAPDQHGQDGMRMDDAIAALEARLQEHPEDAGGWALLGRAYQVTGRTERALEIFKRAHEALPNDAETTVEYAQALALARPDHRIEGEARKLIEGVLAKDPSHQRAIWLLGISDYQAGRYAEAVTRWKALLAMLEPGSEVREGVERQIAEAEALRDGKTPPPASASAQAPVVASGAADRGTPAVAPALSVNVRLAPALAAELDPQATLFVFARAAEGPPMPLAIERLKASDLPASVKLDESKGMLPNLKLGQVARVVVGARVSKSGEATPQKGDLEGLSAPLDVHQREPIELTIDRILP